MMMMVVVMSDKSESQVPDIHAIQKKRAERRKPQPRLAMTKSEKKAGSGSIGGKPVSDGDGGDDGAGDGLFETKRIN